MQCLEEAEQQAEASVDVPYRPLQIVNSFPFVSYFIFIRGGPLPVSLISQAPLARGFRALLSVLFIYLFKNLIFFYLDVIITFYLGCNRAQRIL